MTTTIKSGLRVFSYDKADFPHASESQHEQLATLDGWTCFANAPYHYRPQLPEGMVWADFAGAHGLDFGGPENSVPVPVAALSEYERSVQSDETAQQMHERKQELLESVIPYSEPKPGQLHVDLASKRGHAGIVLLDENGSHYSWQCDGVSLSWRTAIGHYVPLARPAPDVLHMWGDNVYTNDGQLDTALIDGLLDQVLPGWKVDQSALDASCEACVIVVCERDVYPSWDRMEIEEFREKFGPTPPEHQSGRNPDYDGRQAEWIRSPFANEFESQQAEMIGRRAVLVWGNSD
jgi:hypothetical protein